MIFIILVAMLCANLVHADTDPYRWLEDVQSPQALAWVKEHNSKTLPVLQRDPRYEGIASAIRQIVMAPDRLPLPELRSGWIYNFWQDASHVKGVWRRTPASDFGKADPSWQTVLDLDALAKKENENWVWKGALCLQPKQTRCLLSLSRGGKDAVVVREFDTSTLGFVAGGFALPEAKVDLAWRDRDTLLVGTDFGPGTLTLSGYARIIKIWKRGTDLSKAPTLLEGKDSDAEITSTTFVRPEGTVTLLQRGLTFFSSEDWVLDEKGKLVSLPFPQDADLKGVFDHEVLALLRSDWTIGARAFRAGTLVALPLSALGSPDPAAKLETVYEPDPRSAFSGIAASRHSLYLTALENVRGRLYRLSHQNGGWTRVPLSFPDGGTVTVLAADDFSDQIVVQFESFLVPTSQYRIEDGKSEAAVLRRLPDRFEASDLAVEQFEATSTDGTQVPYFLVHKKGMTLDGTNPTLLYGYGGFEISETPYYLSTFGKVWCEKGGVFALANIRGGGEFGPKWHEAALTVHRQRAYDDFASVARDLIARKITSPRRLGIRGGSNGGLLMGVSFTQHPELYHAVVCEVGLLDMLRYSKLLAGYSWVGEYGDPGDPAMAEVIARYSPYQNVRVGVQYPKVFFLTSTADDRVHPGHSRKMVARMEEQGHPVLYYENTEGGHGGAATLEEQVTKAALEDTYLFEQLVD